MDAEIIACARCDKDRRLGHLDPDNLKWYCEDCWIEFSGKSRLCFRCRDFVPNGSVDSRDKRWYCTRCWEFYTKPPPRRDRSISRSRSPPYARSPRSPVRGPHSHQRVFLTPNPIHAQQSQQYSPGQYAPQYPPQSPYQSSPQYHPSRMQHMSPYMQQQYPPAPQTYNAPTSISVPDISYAPMNNGMNFNGGGMHQSAPSLAEMTLDLNKTMDMDLDMVARNLGMGQPMIPNFGPNPFAGGMMFPFDGNMQKGARSFKQKGGKKGTPKDAVTLAKNGAIEKGTIEKPEDSSRRFQGVVKGFGSKGAYGFIMCVETAALYGRDVFIHKTQLSQALGISIDDHPEMRPEDFEVAIEFTVTTNTEKGLPQARDCWLVEDDTLRAKLMADAGIDPSRRTANSTTYDPMKEPPVEMRPVTHDIPPPPPPVSPDSSDSEKEDNKDNVSKTSRESSSESDKADHDDNKSDASGG